MNQPGPPRVDAYTPVSYDQVHRALLVAICLNERTLHNVGIEPHAPNGRKLLLTT